VDPENAAKISRYDLVLRRGSALRTQPAGSAPQHSSEPGHAHPDNFRIRKSHRSVWGLKDGVPAGWPNRAIESQTPRDHFPVAGRPLVEPSFLASGGRPATPGSLDPQRPQHGPLVCLPFCCCTPSSICSLRGGSGGGPHHSDWQLAAPEHI